MNLMKKNNILAGYYQKTLQGLVKNIVIEKKTKEQIEKEQKQEKAISLYKRIQDNLDYTKYLQQSEIGILFWYLLQKEEREPQDIKILQKCTETIKFFKEILCIQNGTQIHEACCMNLLYEYVEADSVIFEKGDMGDKFYIILDGCVSINKKDYKYNEQTKAYDEFKVELVRLNSGNCFGELALQKESKRAASAETAEPTHFAILKKEKFKEILSGIDSGVAFMAHYSNMNFFNGWDYNKIKMVYDVSVEYEYSIHNIVYKEGEIMKGIYFVKNGEFQVQKLIEVEEPIISDKKQEENLDEEEDYQQQQQRVQAILDKKQNMKNNNHLLVQNYRNIQKSAPILSLTQGATIGDEDLQLFEKNDTQKIRKYTVVCISQKGSLYFVSEKQLKQKVQRYEPYTTVQKQCYMKKTHLEKSLNLLIQNYKEQIHNRMKRFKLEFLSPQGNNIIKFQKQQLDDDLIQQQQKKRLKTDPDQIKKIQLKKTDKSSTGRILNQNIQMTREMQYLKEFARKNNIKEVFESKPINLPEKRKKMKLAKERKLKMEQEKLEPVATPMLSSGKRPKQNSNYIHNFDERPLTKAQHDNVLEKQIQLFQQQHQFVFNIEQFDDQEDKETQKEDEEAYKQSQREQQQQVNTDVEEQINTNNIVISNDIYSEQVQDNGIRIYSSCQAKRPQYTHNEEQFTQSCFNNCNAVNNGYNNKLKNNVKKNRINGIEQLQLYLPFRRQGNGSKQFQRETSNKSLDLQKSGYKTTNSFFPGKPSSKLNFYSSQSQMHTSTSSYDYLSSNRGQDNMYNYFRQNTPQSQKSLFNQSSPSLLTDYTVDSVKSSNNFFNNQNLVSRMQFMNIQDQQKSDSFFKSSYKTLIHSNNNNVRNNNTMMYSQNKQHQKDVYQKALPLKYQKDLMQRKQQKIVKICHFKNKSKIQNQKQEDSIFNQGVMSNN